MQNIVNFPSQIKEVSYSPSSKDYIFDLGETLFRSGSFKKSLPCFQKAIEHFIETENFSALPVCYSFLLQALFEQCRFDEIKKVKKEFELMCKKHQITPTARYTLVNIYHDMSLNADFDRTKTAVQLKQILNQALENQTESGEQGDMVQEFKSRLDIVSCLYTYAVYYYLNGEYEKCQVEINNLQAIFVYFHELEARLLDERSKKEEAQEQRFFESFLLLIRKEKSFLDRLELSAQYIKGFIDLKDGKGDGVLWEVYEKANVRDNKYMVPYVFYALAEYHMGENDLNQASLFLKLAQSYIDADNFKLFSQKLAKLKLRLDLKSQEQKIKSYEIILDKNNKSVVEKDKGCVNFKNQFILWDILTLLVLNPGKVYSKQKLAELIWKQDYSPLTHDNKIYVTIKRLRELVEADSSNPRYIFRSKDGYYFRTTTEVLVR